MDYHKAGVNISEANKLVDWLKRKQKHSKNKKVLSGIGSYSALFRASFPKMKKPCLATSVDGVGTKVKLATYFQSYKEVAQDLVAMCVNDLICCGAEPLFFMDYYACSKINPKSVREFLHGVQLACEKSACVLLGGETAEMPGCYKVGDFDCAGFVIGAVDFSNILGAHKVRVGDRILGVSSSGFHSNGFSLLRKIFQKDLKLWKKELLRPTALYVELAKKIFPIKGLRAMAHITGGGLDNLLRVLPIGTKAELKPWPVPSIFLEAKKRAKITWPSLLKTCNCGVGLVLILSPSAHKKVQKHITQLGFSAFDLGFIQEQKMKNKAPSWSLPFSKLKTS